MLRHTHHQAGLAHARPGRQNNQLAILQAAGPVVQQPVAGGQAGRPTAPGVALDRLDRLHHRLLDRNGLRLLVAGGNVQKFGLQLANNLWRVAGRTGELAGGVGGGDVAVPQQGRVAHAPDRALGLRDADHLPGAALQVPLAADLVQIAVLAQPVGDGEVTNRHILGGQVARRGENHAVGGAVEILGHQLGQDGGHVVALQQAADGHLLGVVVMGQLLCLHVYSPSHPAPRHIGAASVPCCFWRSAIR